MKNVIRIGLYVLAIGATIFLMAFAGNENRKRKCSGVEIKIENFKKEFTTDIMLTDEDIQQIIVEKFDSLKGKSNNDINIENIKEVISENDYVKDIEVSRYLDGKLYIKLKQRRPIIRVYGTSGQNFYIDESGTLIPIKEGFPARVLIAGGWINDLVYNGKSVNLYDNANDSISGVTTLRNLHLFARYIDKDPFLRKMITQIDFSQDRKIILIPLVGNQIIEMRTFTNYDKKLENLKIFYQEAINKGGWGGYSKINIEYINQVVCTKI